MRSKLEKVVDEVIYASKEFNSNYMEFVGNYICDKLIWTPGELYRVKNKFKINELSGPT